MTDSNELPKRIMINGDELVLDQDFCAEVLGGAHIRTAKRYEGLGLPFAMVVIPENYIRTDSRGSAESAHDPTRCAWS